MRAPDRPRRRWRPGSRGWQYDRKDSSWPLRDSCSRDALQVASQVDHCERPGPRDQLRDRVRLPEAELEDQPAAVAQAWTGIGDQSLDHVEAIGTGEECEGRLVIPHLGLHRLAVRVRHIRRIRKDEIERTGKIAEEVAALEGDAVADTQSG